jgi:hypothetical protein
VTGVQTCALPILPTAQNSERHLFLDRRFLAAVPRTAATFWRVLPSCRRKNLESAGIITYLQLAILDTDPASSAIAPNTPSFRPSSGQRGADKFLLRRDHCKSSRRTFSLSVAFPEKRSRKAPSFKKSLKGLFHRFCEPAVPPWIQKVVAP